VRGELPKVLAISCVLFHPQMPEGGGMSVSGTPELTISVPCATCGGTGKDRDQYPKNFYQCADCKGTGVTRTPVSCAGCRHADTDDPWSGEKRVWCFQHDHEFDATFGCLSWTAMEATDGNG